MIYNSIGKRISQNLAGQVIATAWGCCMELKGKSVAVGAFDARTGQYVVTGSGPVMTESTDAMKILAEKAHSIVCYLGLKFLTRIT